jgi:hypothetical protein
MQRSKAGVSGNQKTLLFNLKFCGWRPLPDGSLRIVARGVKEDPAGSAT